MTPNAPRFNPFPGLRPFEAHESHLFFGRDGQSDEAAAFVKLLLEASRQIAAPIYIVLTMRSDFLGDCAQFRDLPEAINDSQYLIPRMTRDQRRSAITALVAVGAAESTPRLVQRLLNDCGDDPDQLPILQHALMRTWDFWTTNNDGKTLDVPHYEAIGTMAQALSRHADEAYNESSPQQKKLAEKIFKCLTEKGSDNREIRRQTKMQELCAVANAKEAEVIAVIDAFRREGRSFLMPPPGVALHEESFIDISHESLMRNWARLKTWVEEEAQAAKTYRRLAETYCLFQMGQAEYYRKNDLETALRWRQATQPNPAWAERYGGGYADAMAFLQDSQYEHEAGLQREAERQRELEQARERERQALQRQVELNRQRSRQARRFDVFLVVALAVVAGLGLWACSQWQRASERTYAANYNLAKVFEEKAGVALADAFQNHNAEDYQKAWLYSLAALNQNIHADSLLPISYSRFLSAEGRFGSFAESWRSPQPSAIFYAVAFSPDGKSLASGSLDKRIRLWDFHLLSYYWADGQKKTENIRRLYEASLFFFGYRSEGFTLVPAPRPLYLTPVNGYEFPNPDKFQKLLQPRPPASWRSSGFWRIPSRPARRSGTSKPIALPTARMTKTGLLLGASRP